ncbi:synapse differentiation-inducing gene protein 1-like [Dendronephthya gigantea]|uniref:synapse differentiation-inducing gene protein 1-like n=1 Tax=Dendronephthya gigantea TaxID=151771 RepID=UPI00106D665D|nr:synapse differentiation-inducing gene protein 1-like [Dendronephthya gigantea]
MNHPRSYEMNSGKPHTSYEQRPPAGGVLQPHVIPYTQTQQPTGQTVVVVPSHAVAANYVQDYMGLSICSCLFCFWPLGLIAIVMSCLVGPSRNEGDFHSAKQYSKWAKYLSIASIIVGLILIITVIVIVVASGSTANTRKN